MAFNTKDFVTKAGLVIQGTAAVTTATGANPGAFTVAGGTAIAKNLMVGTTARIDGDTTLLGQLSVAGASSLSSTLSVTGAITGSSTLAVTGATTLSDTLAVTGATTLSDTLAVTGATTLTSTLAVTGDTTLTGALTANAATFNGVVSVSGTNTLTVGTGATTLGGTLDVAGVASITDTTAATTSGAGALKVTGGAYVNKNIVVAGTDSSTTDATANSIYTPGGVGVGSDLLVGGNTVITGNLTVNGTTTSVNSTVTQIVDPVISIGGGVDGAALTTNDGFNKGIEVHYFDTSDKTMFIGRDGTTGRFVVKSNSAYAAADLGSLVIQDATDADATSGALQVNGGVSVSKKVYVGTELSAATVVARNLTAGRVTFATLGGQLTDDSALTYDAALGKLTGTITQADHATSISGGTAGALVYQSATGETAFLSIGTTGQLLLVDASGVPVWGSLTSTTVGHADNLSAGAAGQIPYQTGYGVTAFAAAGNNTDVLTYVDGVPTWVAQNSLSVSYAANAGHADTADQATKSYNINGGNTGQIAFQSGVDSTVFDSSLTYSGGVLSATNVTTGVVSATTVKSSDLTSGRVTLAGTDGALVDSANLTFNGSTLTLGGSAGDIAMSGGNITGVASVTASATVQALDVKATSLTAGRVTFAGTGGKLVDAAALTFDGTTLTADTLAVTNNATVGGTFDVTGATTLAGLTAGATSVTTLSASGTSTLADVNAGATSVTTLSASGTSTLADVNAGATSVSTLSASDAATLSSTLAVTGAATLSSTLAVNSTAANGSHVAGNALTVAGGVGVSGASFFDSDVTINADLYVEGTIFVKGSSLAGIDQITGDTGTFDALVVNNNASVGGTLTSTGNFKVGSGAGTFTVDAATGNTVIGGTLSAGDSTVGTLSAGASTLASASVTGAATVGTTLDVTGATTLAGLTAGASTLDSATVTNNASVGGTLAVTGATTLSSTLSAGASTLASASVTGAATVGTTLDVTGATTLAGLTAGASTLASASVTGAATVGTTLDVTGATTLSSTLSAGASTLASASVTGAATVGTTLDVTGATTLSSTLSAGASTLASASVTGAATVGTTLDVTGATTLAGLTAGASTLDSVSVNNNASVGGTLTVGTATDGTSVAALYSNNVVLASYTSPTLGTSTANLDQFSSATYRTARYTVQVVNGSDAHITEITLFHIGGNVYANEYGISTSNGELGYFEATLAGGNVTLTFTPAAAGCVVKVVRMGITA